MRAWSTVPVLLAVALPALAQQTTESVAEVEFVAEQILFRGTDFVYRFPQGQPIGIEVRADVDSDATGTLVGESHIEWPEALTQSWEGVAGGGELTVDVDLDISLSAVIDGVIDLGFYELDFTNNPIRYTGWSDEWVWSVTKFFDTFLLPGSPMQAVTIYVDETAGAPVWNWILPSNEVFLLYFSPTDCDYYLEFGGSVQVIPNSGVTLTGQKIITRGRAVETADGTVVIPAPNTNPGTARFDSLWQGEVESTFALQLDFEPDLVLWCEEADGTRIVSGASGLIQGIASSLGDNLFSWTLAEDTRPFQSKNTPYDHDLPAIDLDRASLSFGAVIVGQQAQLNLVVEDLGEIDLLGAVAIEGDGFTVSRPDVDVPGGGEQTVTVTFSPDDVGDWEGELTFTTNDPVNPVVVVPLTGRGYLEGEDPDTDTDSDTTAPGKRGCGCDAGAAAPLAGWLILGLPLVALSRRRR